MTVDTEPCPAMIACEVMFVEQRAGDSQGSSVWLVQHVLHRQCSNEQTLFHPFSLVGCQGCCKLSFLPSSPTFAASFMRCIMAQGPEGCLPLPNSHSQLD